MLSEKILFGELRPGTNVIVDAEGGIGEEAKFTFLSEPKPESTPEPITVGATVASEPLSGTNPPSASSSDGPGAATALS
jgi:hypothetical protein